VNSPEDRSRQAAALRQQAEEIVRKQSPPFPDDLASLPPEKIHGMLHELRIHQAELQMQNEELRQAQLEIEAAKIRYTDLFDLAPVGYCALNAQGVILEANLTTAGLLGVARETLLHQPLSRFLFADDQDSLYLLQKKLWTTGESQGCELRMVHATGEILWVQLQAAVAPGTDSTPQCRLVISNITRRKEYEEHLTTALAEKEVLLREIHHRVKNNLAAIVSLFDMQRRMLKDPQGNDILTELSGRIRSMSLIHETLYRADNLARIDFQQYLQALISHLRTSYGSPGIEFQAEAQGVELPLDLAVPCGMIVNELVTNALKYAFPHGQPAPGKDTCRIRVEMCLDEGRYKLTVIDNGVGLPSGFDWTGAPTMGMLLVRMLGGHQLGGNYAVDRRNGLRFTLTFSEQRGRK
jgi:PAS domain S-box-containing protein